MSMLLFAAFSNSIDNANLQEGDVLFIESQSSQSPYIKVGTMPEWSHYGVMVDTPQGLKVMETSRTVRLTSFADFIGAAMKGNWCVKRSKQILFVPIPYRKYIGQPYDWESLSDNGKIYCSEQIWLIYKDQGIEFCKPRQVSGFVCTGIPRVKELMSRRNISMNRYAVAPVHLWRAK